MDILGNMVEASVLSPNPSLYGSLHNYGHIISAFVHDPDKKYMEKMAVMGDTATAIRDPFFFRWHGFIDKLFQRFKSSKKCPPYKDNDLVYDDIDVKSVDIIPETSSRILINENAPNEFNTFWKYSTVQTSGLDFQMNKLINFSFKHLDHQPFYYNIKVHTSKELRKGTVRIFMAPSLDENGEPFKLKEQRHLFLDMDRFIFELKPGPNTIIRKSTDSSITIPLEQYFSKSMGKDGEPTSSDDYCKCGWPQHMLVPKGKIEGAKFKLFVMVSDYEKDKVVASSNEVCKESSSFCGLRDSKYPDARSMGYPFDRAIIEDKNYIYIENFVNNVTNMISKDVLVIHDPKSPKLIS